MIIKYLTAYAENGITIRSYESRKEAEKAAKELEEYRNDGCKIVVKENKTPETMRDIETIVGIASKDRKLTVNGKPFTIKRTESRDIDLVQGANANAAKALQAFNEIVEQTNCLDTENIATVMEFLEAVQ